MPSKIALDKDVLAKLYITQKLSVKKISNDLGYSATCVYNNLLRHGIPIITNSQRCKGQSTCLEYMSAGYRYS